MIQKRPVRFGVTLTLALFSLGGCGSADAPDENSSANFLTGAPSEPGSDAGQADVSCADKGGTSQSTQTFSEEVWRRVNAEREKAALASFSLDSRLEAVAQNYARDMAERHYFSHQNPEGKFVWNRLDDLAIHYASAGENIALGQSTPEIVVRSWMNSPPHRKNILSPDFKKLGVGFSDCYWVQEFTD